MIYDYNAKKDWSYPVPFRPWFNLICSPLAAIDVYFYFFLVVCLWSCPPLRVPGGSAMNLMLQIRHQAIRNPPNHLSRGAWMSTPELILAMIGRLIRTTASYKGIDTRSTTMKINWKYLLLMRRSFTVTQLIIRTVT